MEALVDGTKLFGELNVGFRKGRRTKDSLFISPQSNEIAKICNRQIWAGLLDIKRA